MTGELLEILWRANLVAAAGIVAVIALRWPVARLFGATARYSLWSLVPVAVLAAFLPARLITADASLLAAPAEALAQAQVYFIQIVRPAAEAAALPDPRLVIAVLWLAGAFAAGFLLWRRQRAFELSAGVGELGPAVVGFIRPRIHLPRDFEAAFTPEEQAVILAHEETHLARQDARINGVVAAAQCAFWFNPFVHLGSHLMRLDQEMACDEAVLARRPGDRRAYAQAMLKTQLAPAALTLGCYWPARAQSALEERIAMLKSKTPGRARLLAGAVTVTALAFGAGYTAWAAAPRVDPMVTFNLTLEPQAMGDPLAKLPGEVSGVLDGGVVLIEEEHGVSSSRTLRVGEEYRDGWMLTAVAASELTLGKGGQSRTVRLEDRSVAIAAAETDGFVPVGEVSLSNAVEGERAATARARTPQIQAAIDAGDPRRALDLGGSAADVAAAFAARGGPMAESLARADNVNFVDVNGRLGLSFSASSPGGENLPAEQQDNIRGLIVPPDFAGVTPPVGADVFTPPPGINFAPGGDASTDGATGVVQIRRRIEPAQ